MIINDILDLIGRFSGERFEDDEGKDLDGYLEGSCPESQSCPYHLEKECIDFQNCSYYNASLIGKTWQE